VEVNFSMFSELEDVIITYISGNYLTNTSREKDWDKSNLIKDELYSKLSVFDEETELTINTKINVSVDGNKESISSTLLIRESPFCFATITDNAGIIITENEDYFDTYEYGRYNDIYYYRLLSSFTNLEDDIKTDAEIFELEDNYFYDYFDETYILTANTKTLFENIIDDKDSLDFLLSVYKDKETTLTIKNYKD